MEPQFLIEILIAAAGGFGAYAAIRADLARMHERINAATDRITRLEDSQPKPSWRNYGNEKT
jgi:hypothetical protein